MDGLVRIEHGIVAGDPQMFRWLLDIFACLGADEIMQPGARPARVHDEVLTARQGMDAAVEASEELRKGLRSTGCLRGDRLDDRQQVFGAVVEFTQKRPQPLFTTE